MEKEFCTKAGKLEWRHYPEVFLTVLLITALMTHLYSCLVGKDQRILSDHHTPPPLLHFTYLWSFSSPWVTGVRSLLQREELPPLQCARLTCCYLTPRNCARSDGECGTYPNTKIEGSLVPFGWERECKCISVVVIIILNSRLFLKNTYLDNNSSCNQEITFSIFIFKQPPQPQVRK